MKHSQTRIPADSQTLIGDLVVPDDARGLVLFAHDSGSERLNPRNRSVAEIIQEAGIATLLVDLLTSEEEDADAVTAELRFDIGFLAGRLLAATHWAREYAPDLHIGYLAASTGAAAALLAAAEAQNTVKAIVSHGGRPDLSGDSLPRVRAPTLLVVGGFDVPTMRMSQDAYASLDCEKQLTIIPGAGHLFEEPGTLDQVARLTVDWFERHLGAVHSETRLGTDRAHQGWISQR
jgi:putative phosphoribosyl transferase